MVISPDGKTAYVSSASTDTVIPISIATDTAGKPIRVGSWPETMAITPDGKTLYVANINSGNVTPVSIATGTAAKPINTGLRPAES